MFAECRGVISKKPGLSNSTGSYEQFGIMTSGSPRLTALSPGKPADHLTTGSIGKRRSTRIMYVVSTTGR